jgi:hypothetical protein
MCGISLGNININIIWVIIILILLFNKGIFSEGCGDTCSVC